MSIFDLFNKNKEFVNIENREKFDKELEYLNIRVEEGNIMERFIKSEEWKIYKKVIENYFSIQENNILNLENLLNKEITQEQIRMAEIIRLMRIKFLKTPEIIIENGKRALIRYEEMNAIKKKYSQKEAI